jgi:hypothetical protein
MEADAGDENRVSDGALINHGGNILPGNGI